MSDRNLERAALSSSEHGHKALGGVIDLNDIEVPDVAAIGRARSVHRN
jgi:hypothetical protein